MIDKIVVFRYWPDFGEDDGSSADLSNDVGVVGDDQWSMQWLSTGDDVDVGDVGDVGDDGDGGDGDDGGDVGDDGEDVEEGIEGDDLSDDLSLLPLEQDVLPLLPFL